MQQVSGDISKPRGIGSRLETYSSEAWFDDHTKFHNVGLGVTCPFTYFVWTLNNIFIQ